MEDSPLDSTQYTSRVSDVSIGCINPNNSNQNHPQTQSPSVFPCMNCKLQFDADTNCILCDYCY